VSDYLLWSDPRTGLWNDANSLWSDFVIIQELRQLGGASYNPHEYQYNINKQTEKKKQQIIKVIANLQGIEYKLEKNRNKKITISISDVEFLIDKLNININV
jgi:hypothetical protein